jgi:hypothetical protein
LKHKINKNFTKAKSEAWTVNNYTLNFRRKVLPDFSLQCYAQR